MKTITVNDEKINQYQKKLLKYATIWNQITDTIKELDIFGSYVYLKFNNDYKYRSFIGGIISLIFIAFSLIFFLRNFTNFLSDENMMVKTEQFHRQIPPLQDLNQSTFMFATRIKQDDGNFIDFPDFNINIYHYSAQKNNTGHIIKEEKIPIELEQCTQHHWNTTQDLLVDAKNKDYYQDWLCPKQNDYQISIQGDQYQEYFEELIINIDYCLNSDECRSKQSAINKYKSQNIPFEMVFTNIQINSESVREEVSHYISSPFLMQLSPDKIYKQRNIFLTQTKLNIDSSKIYTEMKDEEIFPLFTQGNIQDEYELYDQNQHGDTIGSMRLRSDYYLVSHFKEYQKLDIFLAQLGGFINIAFIVSALIANFYNQYELDIKLANQLYRFEFKKDKFVQLYQKKKVIKPEDIQKATKKAAEKMFELKKKRKLGKLADQTKDKIKDFQVKQQLGFTSRKEYLIDIFKQYVQRKKIQLNTQFLIYKLSFGTLFDTEENKLIEQARTQMLKDMDIHTLLQKVQEIDKLKSLLLDRNQSVLYNFSPKPVLTIEKENQKDQSQNLLKETPNFDKIGEYKHLFFAYSAVNKSQTQNQVSSRLMQLLGDDLKTVFDSSNLVFTTKDKNFQKLKEKVKETLLKKYRQKKIKQLKYLKAQLKWQKFYDHIQWKSLIRKAINGIKTNEPERWKHYLIRKKNMIQQMEQEEIQEQLEYEKEQKERLLKKPNKNNSLAKIKQQLEKELQEFNQNCQQQQLQQSQSQQQNFISPIGSNYQSEQKIINSNQQIQSQQHQLQQNLHKTSFLQQSPDKESNIMLDEQDHLLEQNIVHQKFNYKVQDNMENSNIKRNSILNDSKQKQIIEKSKQKLQLDNIIENENNNNQNISQEEQQLYQFEDDNNTINNFESNANNLSDRK